uniref:C2H2-type domain-containing protein n=1 Tax=Anisakis simplex TaxID=6269 RepID=A0A0M3J2F3_ANISI
LKYSKLQAKREHDVSMLHHVRLEQAGDDCEHVCRICKFICKELSEYSKHVDTTTHKEKLTHVRMRRAVFEDISEDSTIPPFEDIVANLRYVIEEPLQSPTSSPHRGAAVTLAV